MIIITLFLTKELLSPSPYSITGEKNKNMLLVVTYAIFVKSSWLLTVRFRTLERQLEI